MKKEAKLFVGIFTILLIIVFFYFYQFFGLKFAINAINTVNLLTPENKETAYSMLSSNGNQADFYNGTLAHLATTPSGKFEGIWIWGLNGLRYIKDVGNTFFSNYSICEDGKYKLNQTKINKNSNINYSVWKNMVKIGDYVGVSRAGEVYSYDWWVFANGLPSDFITKTCQNR